MELPVDLVERARRGLVADLRAYRLAPDHALQARPRMSRCTVHRAMSKLFRRICRVDDEVVAEDPRELGILRLVTLGTRLQSRPVAALGRALVAAGCGDRQNPPDRLDRMLLTMLVDEGA